METSSAAESEEEIPIALQSPPDEYDEPSVDESQRMVDLAINGDLSVSNVAVGITDNDGGGNNNCLLSVDAGNNRAKSVEFLCEDGNKAFLKPPENSMTQGDRQLSEQELRFQASLKLLDVPEWFKNAQQRKNSADGFLLGRRRTEPSGWEAAKSTSTSVVSSLQSSRAATPTKGSSRDRREHDPDCKCNRSSRDNLMSPSESSSTRDNSPTPCDCRLLGDSASARKSSAPAKYCPRPSTSPIPNYYGSHYHHRWGSVGSRSAVGANNPRSGSVSPCSNFSLGVLSTGGMSDRQSSFLSTSPASGFTTGRLSPYSVTKPYLGWRSSEKLFDLENAGNVNSDASENDGNQLSASSLNTRRKSEFTAPPLTVAVKPSHGSSAAHSGTKQDQQHAQSIRIYLTPAERLAQSLLVHRPTPPESLPPEEAVVKDEEQDGGDKCEVQSKIIIITTTPSIDQSSPAKSDVSTPETTIEVSPVGQHIDGQERSTADSVSQQTSPTPSARASIAEQHPRPPPLVLPPSEPPEEDDGKEKLTWSPGPELPLPISPRLSKGSIHAGAGVVFPSSSPHSEDGANKQEINAIVHESGDTERRGQGAIPKRQSRRPGTLPSVVTVGSAAEIQLATDAEPAETGQRSHLSDRDQATTISRTGSSASACSNSRPRSPRVWVESSFVGVKPIQSPETPVGDVTSFVFESPAPSGTGNDSPSNVNGDSASESLVPSLRLRMGSAQLDQYRSRANENGETRSRKSSAASSSMQSGDDQPLFSPASSTNMRFVDGLSDQEAELCIRSARAAKQHHQHHHHAGPAGSTRRLRDPAYFDVGLVLDDDEEPGSGFKNQNLLSPVGVTDEKFAASSSPSARTSPDVSINVIPSPSTDDGGLAAESDFGGSIAGSRGSSQHRRSRTSPRNRNEIAVSRSRDALRLSPSNQSFQDELEPLLPASRSSSGKPALTPSPEPFFFEDLEIKIMDADQPELRSCSRPESMADPLSPGGARGSASGGAGAAEGAAAGPPVAGAIGGPMYPAQPPSMTATSHILIQCRNSKCHNGCPIEEAQRLYKTCKNCHTYYCSRECRKAHKPKHQKHCMQLRASSLLTDLMHQIRDTKECFLQLSKLARQGFLSRGAGCVKLFFQTIEELQEFLDSFRLDSSGGGNGARPCYTPVKELMPEEMGPDNYRSLVELCNNYNAETKFVLYVAVCVWSEVPTPENIKFERLLIVKCAKLKLSPMMSPKQQQQQGASGRRERHSSSRTTHIPVNPLQLRQEAIITQDIEEQETLIFASPAGFGTEHDGRALCQQTIVSRLSERGVDLDTEFPDVARRLAGYVERGESFGHVIFYPRDSDTQKFFMCIVMLEVDAERFGNLPADISNVKVVAIGR